MRELVALSRRLAYVLRHHPDSVGIQLDAAGWVEVDALLEGLVGNGRFLDAIRAEGLRPGSRQHVHLSPDVPTARQVGARRGAPVVLRVDAAGLHDADHEFLRAANGVWLTSAVPPSHLAIPDDR